MIHVPAILTNTVIAGALTTGVAKAVKSRARCTTLEAAGACETKFTLYFSLFCVSFFTTFLFKLSYVQL